MLSGDGSCLYFIILWKKSQSNNSFSSVNSIPRTIKRQHESTTNHWLDRRRDVPLRMSQMSSFHPKDVPFASLVTIVVHCPGFKRHLYGLEMMI